jgi:hypothetical protein
MNKFKLLVAALVVMGGVWVLAADEKKPDAAAANPADAAKQMEMMMKMASPGPQHEKLKMMAGKFKADVSFRMAADAPETKSVGSSENKMIMGDRYLKQDYSGDMMGMPFTGMGITGYDNMKKQYMTTWCDSMSTAILVSEGTVDDAGKVITQKAECDCPMEPGKKMQMRMVTTIMDENSHTYDMYQTGPDAKEFKCMSIKYTREK